MGRLPETFSQIARKTERLVIGVMSGTSLDGIDIALVRLIGSGKTMDIELRHFTTYPLSEHWRQRIQAAFSGDTGQICRLNFDLGNHLGRLIRQFCVEHDQPLDAVDAIGCHGQTIYHIDGHSTLQIGEADLIAKMTGILVVSDFRSADIAVGGTGAPLVPYLDRILYSDPTAGTAIQNLGGIGNVTYLPPNPADDVLAFDTGPANAVLNEMVEVMTAGHHHCDQDAFFSAQGHCDSILLDRLLTHPFFYKPLPKSTGREMFGKAYVDQIIQEYPQLPKVDLLRTLVSLVTHSIVKAYQTYLPSPSKVYLCGGGVHHPMIMAELKALLTGKCVEPLPHRQGITADSKEAVAFAVLAHERINNTPANLPSVTGASRPTVLGKISTPC
jgi:anhydro-N-acetylmuramic acid kinase